MIENLLHAYTPLLTWIGLGLVLSRFIPESFLKLLGYGLYWVGVPLQLFVLARHTDLSHGGLIPAIAIGVLLLSLVFALLFWWGLRVSTSPKQQAENSFDDPVVRASLGSFILATILGNTGFVGLTLAQVLTGPSNMDWAVLFSVTNNVIGTYGIAVLIASYFGNREIKNHWWIQVRDLVTVPSLWAFFIGLNTQFIKLPPVVESGLEQAVWVVIAFALLLVGLRMTAIKIGNSLKMAVVASLLKVLIVPLLVGLGATYVGVIGEPRLVLVLMSGTPTGLSVLILAEVYELDRNLLASSIALTFVGLLLVLPLWLAWFS
ncbi:MULTISPECIES: AEC family transporter [unclassified Tolypothrix]|uniref:AEC family transporter n=1 Tax=unclassified Tolypothrix TaxID=2649714 RepID=UPI0005EAAD00|nr:MULTISPECIES: transporter [unclassified Tolypothrix]BAY92347.1 auxin efflux carrier [Microchaete diplosiphon NIES-3275]EKE98362.1 AEC familymalonate efflux carrier protein [Tolypothrix sp. PCC 7601]MBE9083898.1 AEC family transporter [Tolypothrix sp. LEGE 11397]UYD26312.1 AEC family transporter [Tolypothrix sp. PCC 7712]UYD31451.1 AEC family transporter [Tolypothrix sp. PCC 7601]